MLLLGNPVRSTRAWSFVRSLYHAFALALPPTSTVYAGDVASVRRRHTLAAPPVGVLVLAHCASY